MTTPAIPVGDGLLGRTINAHGQPIDDRGALQDVRTVDPVTAESAPAHPPVLWDTGIKVIDLYTPLAFGSTVALQGIPGVGMAVTRDELIHRLADQQGGCAVIAHLDTERHSVRDKQAEINETGVERHTVLVAGNNPAAANERRQVALAALTIAESFVAQGRDVALVVDDALVDPTTIDLLRQRARVVGRGSLTILLCCWQADDPDAALHPAVRPLAEAADTHLIFRRELARQAIWPAIDPLTSSSRFLHPHYVSEEQIRVAEAGRSFLSGAAQTDLERSRARKALLFQAQPFFVAEPFTALPAVYVPRAETVRTVRAILTGAYDAVADKALHFTSRVRAN